MGHYFQDTQYVGREPHQCSDVNSQGGLKILCEFRTAPKQNTKRNLQKIPRNINKYEGIFRFQLFSIFANQISKVADLYKNYILEDSRNFRIPKDEKKR